MTFPDAQRDQYKASFDIQQVLFDGLAAARSIRVEEVTLDQNLYTIVVEQYKLRKIINSLYFSVFLLKKKISLSHIFKQELLKRLAELKSGQANGVVLEENILIIKAELIKVQQQIATLKTQWEMTWSLLSLYTNLAFSSPPVLLLPEVSVQKNSSISRPEIKQFTLEKLTLKRRKDLMTCATLPKAFGTFSYSYGNPPGTNFMRDEFDLYYSVGLKVMWQFFDWNKIKRSKDILNHQLQIMTIKESDFQRSITAAMQKQYAEITQLEKTVQSDRELIGMREKITKTVAVKLTNGTISSTEFLSELNAEKQTKISYAVHKIELIKAKVDYLTLSGEIYSLTP